MEKLLAINLLYLTIVLPFILIGIKRDQVKWKERLVLICSFFLVYNFILSTPSFFPWLKIGQLSWNWTGKLLATGFSLIFYFSFKKYFDAERFINLSLHKKHLRSQTIILVIITLISVAEGLVFYNQPWDTETILFQASLPGIDEEFAYRGIILGLLSTIMPPKVGLGKIGIINPSIYIVGTLFGLIHALKLDNDWGISFQLLYFLKTFLLGTIWSHMTLKGRCVLLPILSHNLSNTLPNLIGMFK